MVFCCRKCGMSLLIVLCRLPAGWQQRSKQRKNALEPISRAFYLYPIFLDVLFEKFHGDKVNRPDVSKAHLQLGDKG